MSELESSLHLAQQPLYHGLAGEWKNTFTDAVGDCGETLSWDLAAILSVLDFGYTCGDHTLISEVKRQPWLSRIDEHNNIVLERIPAHGRRWKPAREIARKLEHLLCEEAFEVCRDRQQIYILMSGGLDSRIVSGVVARLYKEGKLATMPIGVTWGIEDSRDVVYARVMAEILGFEWIHINMSPDDFLRNTDDISVKIGALVSPVHLHCMKWFENVSPDSLVLAASYGDSVGRAEFSGRTILELDYLSLPSDTFGLIRKQLLSEALDSVASDLKALRNRSYEQPKYVICEHEMQGHYMRNMINHAMSVIGNYCHIYQMFTRHDTYSYMWSIHPSLRNNDIYMEMLEHLNPKLARLPWARTNKALGGRTSGAKNNLAKRYHRYEQWIGQELYQHLLGYIAPDWFEATGIFDPNGIRRLANEVKRGNNGRGVYGFLPYETWLWLAAFRHLAEHLANSGLAVTLNSDTVDTGEKLTSSLPVGKPSMVKRFLSRYPAVYNFTRTLAVPFLNMHKNIRRFFLSRRSVLLFSPEYDTERQK